MGNETVSGNFKYYQLKFKKLKCYQLVKKKKLCL